MALRDLLRPFERRQLTGLGPALDAGLDPNLAYQMMQQVIGGAQTRRANQRQQFGQAAQQFATDAASMYGPPTSLSGLASAYGQAAGLGPQGQGRLEDLVTKLYPGGLPSATSTLDQADKQAIGTDLLSTFSASTNPRDPQVLYDMRRVAAQRAISVGMDPTGVKAAEDYAEEVYAQLAGIPREQANLMGRQGYTPPAAPRSSSGGLLNALKPSNWFFQG